MSMIRVSVVLPATPLQSSSFLNYSSSMSMPTSKSPLHASSVVYTISTVSTGQCYTGDTGTVGNLSISNI